MANVELVVKISEDSWKATCNGCMLPTDVENVVQGIKNGTPLTLEVLADALMEERIRGKLDSDTTFEKDIIPDVKCILTVSIRDHRPCYCGAELREVWRESEEQEE